MISFPRGNARFDLRAGAIIIHNDHLLLAQNASTDWYFVPGGRVEMGESSLAAVRRELREELGVDASVQRLLWIAEYFYEGRITPISFHEVAFYYLATLSDDAVTFVNSGPMQVVDGGANILFDWLPLDRVADLPIWPEFLRQGIGNLPLKAEHMVLGEAPR